MKRSLLLVLGSLGLVAAVFALRGSSAQGELRTEYYASGQLQSECASKDGVREGACKRFWPDGRPQAEGQYHAGVMSGRWTFWNQDGSEDGQRTGEYRDGQRAGG